MKNIKVLMIIFLMLLGSPALFSQNVLINVLTQNSGIVKQGQTIYFEVTINNTSPYKTVPVFKLKPQISFPTNLVEISSTGHILPNGWSIISIKNGVLTLSNGTDKIPENESRTIMIAIKGKSKGGPSTIIGNITFSNGIAPGSETGTPLAGDNNADNSSSSTVRVE